MRVKILYLFLALFMAMSVFAQKNDGTNSFIIRGQVVDSLSNESVPYVTLRIAWAADPKNPIKLLACDEDGKFTADLNKAG